MPPRQLFVEILQTVGIDLRCGTDQARGKRRARNTRQLQRATLLRGQSLELCLDHVAQIVRHREFDLSQGYLQLPKAVRMRKEASLHHVL
jgi:hypothetical protein